MSEDVKRVTRAFSEGAAFGFGSLVISLLANAVMKKLQAQIQSA